MQRLDRTILTTSLWTLTVAVVASALLLALVRLMLPGIQHYRPEVEDWVSNLLGQRVLIGSIQAHWQGWSPELQLADVQLLSAETPDGKQHALLKFAHATLSIDTRASLAAGELRPGQLVISGASLALTRHTDGSFEIQGVNENAQTNGPAGDNLARWLLSQGRLELNDSRILWVDQRMDRAPVRLNDVTLRLRNSGARHQLEGTLSPQADMGRRISFALDVEGDLLTPSWSGSLFVQGDDINVSLDRGARDTPGIEEITGRLNVSLWSTWKFGRLERAEGKLQAREVEIAGPSGAVRVDDGSATLLLIRDKDAWALELGDLAVATVHGVWPNTRLQVNYREARGAEPARLVATLDHLRLEDINALLPIVTDAHSGWVKTLVAAAPRAVLSALHLTATPRKGEPWAGARLRARFSGLASQAAAELPSLDGFHGTVEATREAVVVALEGGRIAAKLPHFGAALLRASDVGGRLTLSRAPSGVRMELDDVSFSAPGLQGALTGRALWPEDGTAPEVSVALKLREGDLRRLPDYLPVSGIPAGVRKWALRAVRDGKLLEGDVLLHGKLSDFPFDGGKGRIEASLRVQLDTLRYAKTWPGLQNIRGEIRFDGRAVRAHIDSARMFNSRLGKVRIAIADISAAAPRVEIHGRASGVTQDAVRFLAESPLRSRFKHLLENVSVHGKSALELKLGIPLKGAKKFDVAGTLELTQNIVDLHGLINGLEQVNGAVGFTADGVSAKDVTANYLGQPISLSAGAAPERPNATRITINGSATRDYLADHLHNAGLIDKPLPEASPLLSRLRGDARWRVMLDIPNSKAQGQDRAKLRVETDLLGAALDLPAPFNKRAGERKRLVVENTFGESGQRNMRVRFGRAAAGAFELTPDGQRYRLERGAIHFGATPVRLPATAGIHIDGSLEHLAVREWFELLQAVGSGGPKTAPAPDKADTPLRHVNSIDVDVSTLHALGTPFNGVRISGQRLRSGAWATRLAGDRLQGEIVVPKDLTREAVQAHFDRLVLHTDPAPAQPLQVDPATLPALNFSAKQLTRDGLDLGLVEFTTSKRPQGLRIDSLYTLTKDYETRATGSWMFADGQHNTHLDARVQGEDLGKLLRAFGYESSGVAGGATEIALNASWPGRPGDFRLRDVGGILNFRTSAGRLVQVNRGKTGRVFGLLTLNSLRRSLSLDFSDLFEEGLRYDRMEGSFAIEDGNAYTNNLFLDSDTARIEIAGRTGLVNEDYDQLVTVTPKLSASLPLAPIWLAEKMFKKKLFDKAFAFQYTITGTWDAPLVERVVVEKQPADRD